MKRLFIVVIFLLALCSCGTKEEPASVLLADGTTLTISKTEDKAEVLKVFETLKEIKTKPMSTGAKIKLHNDLSGSVNIGNEDITHIVLNYDIDADMLLSFKTCLLEGNLMVKGAVHTDSDAFSFKSDYNVEGSFFSDEEFLYYDVYANIGSTSGSFKQKMNYEEYASTIRNQARLYFELLNYYNIFELMGDNQAFIEAYSVYITSTTKDSFEIKMDIPVDDNESMTLFITIDCISLFPKILKFEASEMIAEELKKKYVDEYLTEEVEVESAHFNLVLELEYGSFSVEDRPLTEKDMYSELSY